MRKAKKSPKFQYGIEITKPFSKEMYNHNDMVASEMKANILHHWNQIIKRMEDDDKWTLDRDWDEDEIKSPNIRDQILKNSPEDNKDFFVVTKVVE